MLSKSTLTFGPLGSGFATHKDYQIIIIIHLYSWAIRPIAPHTSVLESVYVSEGFDDAIADASQLPAVLAG